MGFEQERIDGNYNLSKEVGGSGTMDPKIRLGLKICLGQDNEYLRIEIGYAMDDCNRVVVVGGGRLKLLGVRH